MSISCCNFINRSWRLSHGRGEWKICRRNLKGQGIFWDPQWCAYLCDWSHCFKIYLPSILQWLLTCTLELFPRLVSIVLILELMASDWDDYMETEGEKVRAHVIAQMEDYFERMVGLCGKIKLKLPVLFYFMGRRRYIRVLVMQTTLSNSWEYINAADNTNCLKVHFEVIYRFCVHSFVH